MTRRLGVSPELTASASPGQWPRVALVSAPFGPLEAPSIALGILKAMGVQCGADIRVFYLGFSFAKMIGYRAYSRFAAGAPSTHDLAGEWIFAHLASENFQADTTAYLSAVIQGDHPDHRKNDPRTVRLVPLIVEDLHSARTSAEEFVAASAVEILSYHPDIVGFTSVFQQNMASLAIAKQIKRIRPRVFTVMGGANCEDPMGEELLRHFPALDSVVSGEGEDAFTELISAFHESRDLRPARGLRLQGNGPELQIGSESTARIAMTDLDSLPEPDYDEYFAEVSSAPSEWALKPQLVLETSRGCWWGQKHHCTFCGLNGLGLTFRRKSQEKSLREIESMLLRYPVDRVAMVDNILDMSYFRDYLPALAQRSWNIRLFYETKANLRRDQLELLRAAGVTAFQPGIESFSDAVLKTMRKGVRGIQNIQLLKWCLELGIEPEWNLLWGFPGEEPDDYFEMARIVPLLSHLPPPNGGSRIRLDRYSPNYDSSSNFGLVDVSPYPAYQYVYGLDATALSRIAYFFTFRYSDGRNVESYTAPVVKALSEWRDTHAKSVLTMVDKDPYLLIWDTRACAVTPLTVLHGWTRSLYLACDKNVSLQAIRDGVGAKTGSVSDEAVVATLRSLVDRGLLYYDSRSYLALAVSLDAFHPSVSAMSALIECIKGVAGDGDADEFRVPLDEYLLPTDGQLSVRGDG